MVPDFVLARGRMDTRLWAAGFFKKRALAARACCSAEFNPTGSPPRLRGRSRLVACCEGKQRQMAFAPGSVRRRVTAGCANVQLEQTQTEEAPPLEVASPCSQRSVLEDYFSAVLESAHLCSRREGSDLTAVATIHAAIGASQIDVVKQVIEFELELRPDPFSKAKRLE